MKTIGIILAIIAFVVMVIAHEFGHFSSAKMMGIKVEEFSVGMGPQLLQRQKGETLYSLRAIPLGGYCAFENEDSDKNDPRLFSKQPWWSKILVLLCGPFMNIILGILMLYLVFQVVNPAVSPLLCLKAALKASAAVLQSVCTFIASLFNGTIKSDDVSGVVGIVTVVGEAAEYGLANVFYLIAMIGVNIGYMNLLPFPALDGGRIILTLIRAISGNRIPEKFEEYINAAGMIILFTLMFFLIFKDTVGLFR